MENPNHILFQTNSSNNVTTQGQENQDLQNRQQIIQQLDNLHSSIRFSHDSTNLVPRQRTNIIQNIESSNSEFDESSQTHDVNAIKQQIEVSYQFIIQIMIFCQILSLMSLVTIIFKLSVLIPLVNVQIFLMIKAFLIYRELKLQFNQLRTTKKQQYVLDIVECLTIILYIGLIQMKLLNLQVQSLLCLIPYLLFTIIKCFSQDQNGASSFIENLIIWNWKSTLWSTWILLLILIFYTSGLFVIVVCTLIYTFYGQAQKYQAKGLFWLFCIALGSTLFVLFFSFGILEIIEGDGSLTKMQVSFSSLLVFSFVLTIFTFRNQEDIKKFLSKMNGYDDILFNQENNQENILISRQQQQIKLKTNHLNNIPQFLNKLTSTYFKKAPTVTLTHKTLPKKETQKAKKKQLKIQIPTDPSQSKNTQLSNNQKQIESFRKSSLNSVRQSSRSKEDFVETKAPKDTTIDCNVIKSARQQQIPSKLSDKSETNQCLVCFDKIPDAVFMDCGHGGICYECSLDVWKNTNQCYLCRNPIESILHIDPKVDEDNKIKVLSITNMVIEEAYE